MSEVNITLSDLLNISFGVPQQATVNFSALHALLHAVLKQLGLGEVKIRWSDSTTGDTLTGDVSGSGQDSVTGEGQLQLQRSPSPGNVAELESKLRSRIQSCEDGVSKAMRLIQELHNQRDSVKDEMKELHHQQKVVDAAESLTAVETCCHRMDVLEDTVRSLRDTVQKCPDPEQLSRCVTWDVLQSALLSEGETHKELVKSGVVDLVRLTHCDTPASSSPLPVEDSVRTAAATPPVMSGEIDTRPAMETSLVLSGPQQTHPVAAAPSSSSERYSETVETLRSISKLRQRFNELESRVAELGERKVDKTQLDQLREVVTEQGSGSQDVTNKLMGQLKEQRALMDSLVSDREKLDYCEEMLQILTSQQNETSSEADAGSGSVDSDSSIARELRQQISLLRRTVQKVEEDLKQLKARQASNEERLRDQDLRDQLNDLRGRLESMKRSQTSERERGQGKESREGSVEIERKLSRLFEQYKLLQDTMDDLVQQQAGARAGPQVDRESVELVNEMQTTILQLQAECEKLHETTKCLQDDNRQKQNHIEELFKTTEEMEEKKADKQMVKSEIKADKSALEGKVSRVHFDSMTEQLNIMYQELQSRVMDQTQDWHKVKEKLSSDMDCKLLKTELESVKKQLDNCKKSIQEKLQSQGAAEHDDAAAIRKQLVERFHCLCCDRPIVKPTPGPQLMTLPSTPGFPSHKSIRPFTVYTLEQFRQHYRSLRPGSNRYSYELARARRRRAQLQRNRNMMNRQVDTYCDGDNSLDTMRDKTQNQDQNLNQNQNLTQNQNQPEIQNERIAELADYSHLAVSRTCGGSHTATSSSQRRTGLQHMKHPNQPEVDGVIQSEEVDIVGLDGHIYRGRLNPPAIRTTETKLPTISTKDVTSSKVKDKSKCSPSHKPAVSPELGLSAPVHPPLSAKSAQCSRSASSSSGRDWPVSALGCTSQSSITQASAAAETTMEPQESQQADL